MVCENCNLYKECNTNFIQTDGDISKCEILFAGEAPGQEEDRGVPGNEKETIGKPFVGRAGRLLRMGILQSGLNNRFNVCLTNVVRCRPPNNRIPGIGEIKACLPYTLEEIFKMDNLKLIVAIGNTALRTFVNEQKVTSSSGTVRDYEICDKKIKLMPLIHPSYVLRNPGEYNKFIEHIARINDIMGNTLHDEKDFGEYNIIYTLDEWENLVAKIKKNKKFVYDIETTGLNPFGKDDYITCIGFLVEPRKTWTLPLDPNDPEINGSIYNEILDDMYEIFSDKSIKKFGHYLKSDNLWMRASLGIKVLGTSYDTESGEYLLSSGSKKLKELAYKHTRIGGYEKLLGGTPDKVRGKKLYKYCLVPETKILMSDFSWKKLGDAIIGDKLVAFSEYGEINRGDFLQDTTNHGALRKWKYSQITSVSKEIKTCIKVTTEHGIIIGTPDHNVLSYALHGGYKWIKLSDIKYKNSGRQNISFLFEPWEQPNNFEIGWLSGILDGEGSIRKNVSANTFTTTISQNQGGVLDKIVTSLKNLGFEYNFNKRKYDGNCILTINGGLKKQIEFLGKTRPIRLINKAMGLLEEYQPAFWTIHSPIIGVEDIGILEVVNITTDTRTFIANGYAVHNCGMDCDVTDRVMRQQIPALIEENKASIKLLNTLLIPIADVLVDMEFIGIKVDLNLINQAKDNVAKITSDFSQEMRLLPSVVKFQNDNEIEFNPNSHPQITKILFDKEYGGLHPSRKTDSGKPSTDLEALRYYEGTSKLCKLLISYSNYNTMKKTFIKELLLESSYDGRIHTRYYITETKTGRLSSRDPNLQNIPKGEKDILHIRKVFIADDGFKLVEFDYNQHELRCMAEISKDAAMVEALEGDVHRSTAASVLGIRPEDVTEDQRSNNGKSLNFGPIYGQTAYGVAEKIGCTKGEAQIFLDRHFNKYKGVKAWMDMVREFVLKNGYVYSITGRRRYFPNLHEMEERDLEKAIREGINMPIQALASDIMLYSILGIQDFLDNNNLKSFLTLEVHDSVLMNIHESEIGIIPTIQSIMETYPKNFIQFELPLKVDTKIGENWEEMKEVKNGK